jgi:hypothetical protein
MAYVVLTSSQKSQLLTDAGFQNEVKWAVLNKAAYWKGLDGTSVPGGQTVSNIARWAKSRHLAAQIQFTPGMADDIGIVSRFLVYIKNIACYDNSNSFSTSSVVTKLLQDSSFDTMADFYFDDQIAVSLF